MVWIIKSQPTVSGVVVERIYSTAMPKVVIAAAMVVAVFVLVMTLRAVLRKEATAKALWTHFVFWTMAPPFWFALEYFWLFKEYGNKGTFDAFKYGQDGAHKFWAAVVALIGARLFKEIQSTSKLPASDETQQEVVAISEEPG